MFEQTSTQRSLYILDGSGYVFRAYYGMPELTDMQWRPVHAVYWFFRMVCALLVKKPSEFVIAWDAWSKTIRKDNYEDYKANRTSMPVEFKRQMKTIKEITDRIGRGSYQVSWYEADDIIATVAKQAATQDRTVTIVSSDKDLKQLITQQIEQYDAMKDITTSLASFREIYGYEPTSLLDYLSLVWDASDNVPWVPGIGKKTAEKLILEYWTLEAIYENLQQIWWAVAKKLEEWKDKGLLSKELITLYEVPDLHYNAGEFTCTYDYEKMKSILIDEYKFTSLEKHLDRLKNQRQWGEQLWLFW